MISHSQKSLPKTQYLTRNSQHNISFGTVNTKSPSNSFILPLCSTMKRASSVIDIVEEIEIKEKLRQLEDLFQSLPDSRKGSKTKMSGKSKTENKEKKHGKKHKKGKTKKSPEADFTGIFERIMAIIDAGESTPSRDSPDASKEPQCMSCDDRSNTSTTDECSFSSQHSAPETPRVSILRKREHRAGPKGSSSQTSFCIEKNECHFIPPNRSESFPDLFYSWEEIESFREDMMEEIRSEQFLWQLRGGNGEEE